MGPTSRQERKKKNKARRAELTQRSVVAYRRRAGLKTNEEEVPLAGIFRRFLALGIDQITFAVFNTFCLIFIFSIYSSVEGLNDGPPITITLIPQLLFGVFYWIPLVAKRGQTFGLRKFHLIVIKEDGTGLLSWKQSFTRWFSAYGASTCLVMVLSPLSTEQNFTIGLYTLFLLGPLLVMSPALWSEKRQGFHDAFAHSVVVTESPLLQAQD